MGTKFRVTREPYEVCDLCEIEIHPYTDSEIMTTWPVIKPEVSTGGVLKRFKYLFVNWYSKETYKVHTDCADAVLRSVIQSVKPTENKDE